MKKQIALLLAASLVFSLAACGKKETEPETAIPVVTTAAAETQTAGLANPMVEISDTGDFAKELGIEIDAGLLYSDAKMFVTDGRLAECQFAFENAEGETVDCSFRATKEAELAENLSGIYDPSLKEISDFDYTHEGGTFTITLSANDAEDILLYTWQIGEVYYSFVMKGHPAGQEISEALDSVMLAIGIDASGIAEKEEEESWYELSAEDEVLSVWLKANATTGYQWTAKILDEGTLELITDEYVEDAHADGMVGVGGTYAASFKATDPEGRMNADYPSQNSVTFVYSRDPEGNGIPDKVIDLSVTGKKLEIMGVHEPDLFNTPDAEDGEYEATLSYYDMLEENELSFYALIGLPETVTFTEEEVRNLKAGDTIGLSDYGLSDISVEKVNWMDETAVEINEDDRMEYRKDLDAWVIVGLDDDVCRYIPEKRQIRLTNETVIDDQMEEIIRSGNSGTVYDKMGDYYFADVTVTVKDGFCEKIVIYYHP